MILIFSVSHDPATNAVMRWLEYFGRPALRINHDQPAATPIAIRLTNNDFRFEWEGQSISSQEVSAVWYRKGKFWIPQAPVEFEFEGQGPFADAIQRKLVRETEETARYFHHLVREKGIRVLGNPFLGDPNKLTVLHEARKLGLQVPNFELTNQLTTDHLRNPANFVSKAVSDCIYFWDAEVAGRGYFSYTEDLTDVVDGVRTGDLIPISLIQEKIQKQFEIRSFFLDGQFRTTVIISQNDPRTATDHRKYNHESPNRNIPAQLPIEVEQKLILLFKKLKLNTGSVDMIVNEDGEYVFLEINPVGMYGNLVAICNFDIDQEIAKWLCGESQIVRCSEIPADRGSEKFLAAGIT